MSKPLALGLLTQIVERMQQDIADLTARVDELEGVEPDEDEGQTYMDGTPVR